MFFSVGFRKKPFRILKGLDSTAHACYNEENFVSQGDEIMEFACGTGYHRPVRLSEETRAFADRSMHGMYGDDAMTHRTLPMDDVPGFA